ncbi:S49 family peptidase [Stappia sp. F7233]|uniref:S49 family peptidase n=1 Tax=Stappia albiluteola TaxID=2758565 RepID=A0A839AFE6_9HYPH|nr:S49 family peptidase [Stappia albiluteola]MBA5778433.1 S49 family peptidase [Stappia albiluteola]
MLKSVRKFLPGKLGRKGAVVPVVRLHGPIGLASPLRPGMSLSTVASPLERAFSHKDAPAVALIVNSPGGSPVQSRLIFQRIRQLAEEKSKDVLVFVEDVAASGGYMIALAGDEIIADATSIVGSIGVVAAGFGFSDLIGRLGIERRVYTAGEKKVVLDPFQPEREEDVVHLRALQQEVHEVFIEMVRARRGDVLSNSPDLFSGLFWTGRTARDLGLVDRLGDLRSVVKERFGKETELRLVGAPRSIFPRRPSVGISVSTEGLADDLVAAAEIRALWARFGL